MDLFKRLFTNKETDITVCGVGFHSFVLKMLFESCRNTMFQGNVFERVEEIIEAKEERQRVEVFKELKKVVYFSTDIISPELAIHVYILLDYLGNVDSFEHLFKKVGSLELLEYLLVHSDNIQLIRCVAYNTKEKISNILDVSEKVINSYLCKMYDSSLVCFREYLKGKPDPSSLNNYAFMLQKGLGGEKDNKKARELYWINWEENKNDMSLNNYAYLLHYGLGGEKDEKKARELHWMNWEENKNNHSLNNYAYLLHHGLGGEKDEKKARELYWLNWEENKNSTSLHNYADMLQKGLGGEEDEKKARELHWMNWEENKNKDSLGGYIHMLKNGIGGEKNEETAQVLQSYIN